MSEPTYQFDESGTRRIVSAVRAVERANLKLDGLKLSNGARDTRSILCRIIGAADRDTNLFPAKFVGLAVSGPTTSTTSTTTTTTTTTAPPTSTSTTSTTTTTPCPRYVFLTAEAQDAWLALNEHDAQNAQLGDVFSALVAGQAQDELPICIHSDSCDSKPTTTTGCPGHCEWTFNFTTHEWHQTAKTCPTACNCQPPRICPNVDDPCAIIKTNCVSGKVGQPVNCGGTSTTTTTTLPPSCSSSCRWVGVEGTWIKATDPCPLTCPCSNPGGVPDDCAEDSTPCTQITPYCNGSCRFKCYPDFGWIAISSSCGSNIGSCGCQEPTVDCVNCGSEVEIDCDSPDAPPVDGTTTTIPPDGQCTGDCVYTCDESLAWVLNRTNCTHCQCTKPGYACTDPCEQGVTPCGTTTTSTTTTTTTTSTTTSTTPPPCGQCVYLCGGGGTLTYQSDNCTGACACPFDYYAAIGVDPPGGRPDHWCFNGFSYNTNCVTTTTTLPPTTTTTSTTSGPCSGSCDWLCSGGIWHLQSSSCVNCSCVDPSNVTPRPCVIGDPGSGQCNCEGTHYMVTCGSTGGTTTAGPTTTSPPTTTPSGGTFTTLGGG